MLIASGDQKVSHSAVRTLHVTAGPWTPADPHDDGRLLVVVDGMLLRDMSFGGTVAAELVGPDDLVHLAREEAIDYDHFVTWTALSDTRIADVDLTSAAQLESWPRLGTRLVACADEHARRATFIDSIGRLGRVEDRVLGMLWHYASRWGRVTAPGIEVELDLTHAVIGRLVGARRPTVSIAIKRLGEAGLACRTADGTWLLAHGAISFLGAPYPETGSSSLPSRTEASSSVL